MEKPTINKKANQLVHMTQRSLNIDNNQKKDEVLLPTITFEIIGHFWVGLCKWDKGQQSRLFD